MIIDYFADKGRPSWLKILEGVNANEYGTLYRHFDIAIAPLQNTKFNHHKSPLKIAEAGAYRLPIVVSAVDPYGLHWDNDGMFMVRNSFEGWYNRLEELIVKPKIREQVGELNKAYCENVFNLDVENERRLKFYEKCISNIQDHH